MGVLGCTACHEPAHHAFQNHTRINRPVSLTNICCKIQEHILISNILKHLDEYNILADCQHGFRARRSCETQLLTLADELVSGLDKSQQHDIIVLDFSKPFDRVPHERLLPKMDHYDVSGSTLEWIGAFLTDRVQQVKVEGATSYSIQVLSGVPQGTVLGPLLFLVFINDLPDCVESEIRLFAIYCILYRCIKDTNDCEAFQKDLNNLSAWEKKLGMAFYPVKCSAIRVSKGAKIRNRYNQVPHLTQDTNGKVTNSQIDTTNESQEVNPFPTL